MVRMKNPRERLITELCITVGRPTRANMVFDGGNITHDWDMTLARAGLVVILHGILGLRSLDTWVGLVLELCLWCGHFDGCTWISLKILT